MDLPATSIQNVSAARGYGRGQAPSDPEERLRARSGGTAEQAAAGVKDTLDLSPEARKQLETLKSTDQKVRAHEAAHMAAGSGIVRGSASFSTQRGPDGQMYATGGEVSIDTSAVPDNPRATLAKAQQIQAAALAPADPSSQDRKVAAQASQMAAQASAELARGGSKTRGVGLDLMA